MSDRYVRAPDGQLRFSREANQERFRQIYHDLMTGPLLPSSVFSYVETLDLKPNCLVTYPDGKGAMRLAALLLYRMQQTLFRVIHTHYLVEVFTQNSEEDGSLSGMWAPFFVLMHGIIPTPNRRLNDLIQEFCEYKLADQVPFMMVSINTPSQVEEYFRAKALPVYEIRSQFGQTVIK